MNVKLHIEQVAVSNPFKGLKSLVSLLIEMKIVSILYICSGILMVIFFSASIYHANTVLVHQAALKVSKLKFEINLHENI